MNTPLWNRLKFGLLVTFVGVLSACGGGSSAPVVTPPVVTPTAFVMESGGAACLRSGGCNGNDGGGAGVGGGGGGGGEGAVGAGVGLTKARNVLARAYRPDGTVLATAELINGLVSINPGSYTGPFILEFTGKANGEYYDESKRAWVPFANQKLRVMVASADRHLSANGFTEAAYQYAIKLHGSDAALDAAKMNAANKVVQDEINTRLAVKFKIGDVTILPTLIDDTKTANVLDNNPPGIFGAVLAGTAIEADGFSSGALASPALIFANQLASDILDNAKIDVSSTPKSAYSTDLSTRLAAGILQAVSIWGTPALQNANPAGNTAPVANAGPPHTGSTGRPVTLDGSASTDANGDSLIYFWTLTSRPTGSTAALAPANYTAQTTFVPDQVGTYVATLSVSDGNVISATPSTVTINVTPGNTAPIAVAGHPQSLGVGQQVTLSGIDSSDANGDPLTYSWTLSIKPSNSQATLTPSRTDPAGVSFVPDVTGTYVATLVVNDGLVNSAPSTVMVFAGATPFVIESGFVWSQTTTSQFGTWAQAKADCDATIAGLTGWRLPTQAELQSLYASNFLQGRNWTLGPTWTSTTSQSPTTTGHVVIDLSNGNTQTLADTSNAFVTCLR